MIPVNRATFILAAAALLLGGCQMTKGDGGLTRAQRAMLTSEGFAPTARGWEFSMADRLLFATDEDVVRPEQAVVVRRIAGRLIAVGLRRATIEGHADDTGRADYNERLSQRRADAVAAVMTEAGFAPGSLATVGLGERFPIDNNKTREGRRENRRVVILITTP